MRISDGFHQLTIPTAPILILLIRFFDELMDLILRLMEGFGRNAGIEIGSFHAERKLEHAEVGCHFLICLS
jgi:hypothetical protein